MVNFSFGQYWSGNNPRFTSAPNDRAEIKMTKIESTFMYRVTSGLDVGVGGGFIELTGDGFDSQPHPVATALSVTITPLAFLPQVLVISPGKHISSVPDLVRVAKAKPGTMIYASAGVGTATQLNAERFRLGAGIDVVHVPFKGTPEALTEIIAGRVDYYFCPVNAVLPMITNGMLGALAMVSSRRSAALADLPTTIEAGIPNSDYNFWVGMFAPACRTGVMTCHKVDKR